MADAAATSGDWFDPFVNLNMSILEGIAGIFGSAGAAIILYTILLKLLTWPLQQPALRISSALRLVSPQVELIKKIYEDSDDRQGKTISRLYKKLDLNPLPALLPILFQLPIFVALFRGISRLAQTNAVFKLPFLWIPSLAGPVTDGTASVDWLIKTRAADHFEPLVGWETAVLYLVLPALVVASQLASQRINASSQDSEAVNNFFPGFICIACLVSPSGLGLYWLTNNLITTAQTAWVQGEVAKDFPEWKKLKDEVDATAPKDEVRNTRGPSWIEECEPVIRSISDLFDDAADDLEAPPMDWSMESAKKSQQEQRAKKSKRSKSDKVKMPLRSAKSTKK